MPQLNWLFVTTGVFVVQHFNYAAVAGARIRTGLQLAVLAIRKPSRNGQSDGQMVGSRREERGNVARLRQCITLWNGERQTILEYSKSVHQSHSSVAQRISI